MGRKTENTGFICRNCGAEVLPRRRGGIRNHCPFCLHSLHVDVEPGDRASDCHGDMEPVAVRYNTKKGWQVLHRCSICGFERFNMLTDEPPQPDNMQLIRELMEKGATL